MLSIVEDCIASEKVTVILSSTAIPVALSAGVTDWTVGAVVSATPPVLPTVEPPELPPSEAILSAVSVVVEH